MEATSDSNETPEISRRKFLRCTVAASVVTATAKQAQGYPSAPTPEPPADGRASREARALFNYLRQQTGKTILSGQTDYPDLLQIAAETGKSPAILNLDFMGCTARMGGETGETQKALDWSQKRQGLVSFQWHWASPLGAKGDASGVYTVETDFNLAEALQNPVSEAYHALLRDIDDVAAELKKLAKAKIPVLFRPLHEAQGGWFWWGAKGAQPCIALYRLLFNRLAQRHKLHNLLWVWTAIPDHHGNGSAREWYPGDRLVDVVAADYLQDPKDFQALAQLTGGKKIVALAETMNPPVPEKAFAEGANWAYWVAWAKRDWNSASANDMKNALLNPRTITLESLSLSDRNKR